MSDDREGLNEALRGMGYDVRGHLVVVRPGYSETREVHRAREIVIAMTTMMIGGAFAADGIRLERFRKNPLALWAHDYEGLPVARSLWERVRRKPPGVDELMVKLHFHGDTELSREVWELVDGVDDDVEIYWEFGVIPIEWNFSTTGLVFVTKWDVVEMSAVPSAECAEEIRRRIKDRKISSPAMLRSVEYAEPPEPEPEPEKTSADEAEGPYSWRAEIRDERWCIVVGPGLETRVGCSGDAAILASELNDAYRRGRESAAVPGAEEPGYHEPDDWLEPRVKELEKWRAAMDDKFARVREQFERDTVAVRRWGDGLENGGSE